MNHPATALQIRCLLLAAAGIVLTGRLAAQEAAFPITVTVKTIQSQSTPPPSSEMSMQQPVTRLAEPTMPSGKLPQYQMGYGRRDRLTETQRATGALLFSIALPDHDLLIRATITIDGEPFPTARKRRIDELLAANQLKDDSSSGSASSPRELSTTPDDADDQPPLIVGYQMATDSRELLRRYAAAMSNPISADEARWLFSNWGDGPELLLLNDHFQSFRAEQRPVFQLLDRDRDGAISQSEMETAVEAFQQCDFNRDGIADALEIERAARDLRLPGDYQPGARSLQRLRLVTDSSAEPDLEVLIEFDTENPESSKLSLVSAAPGFKVLQSGPPIPGTLSLQVDQHPISISAVQQMPSDQISIGAVIDGYPLLPVLDPNNDGKFTVRELRTLTARLKTLDADGDGRLTMAETASTTRICFGLGATVHRELANLRDVPVPKMADIAQPPEWFVRMDRNGDDDLTRDEFPGTDKQFDELDRDRDGLISAGEAVASEPATDTPSANKGSTDE